MGRNYHKPTRPADNITGKHTGEEWPQDCLALAGRFPDFPLREEIDAGRNSGASKPADQVFDRLEAKYAAKADAETKRR